MVTMYGTCVAVSGLGILLRGASGSGKSDLALRLIDAGAVLVADDQVVIRMEQDRLIASAPTALAGLLEVRGVGLLQVASAPAAPLGLIVDLVAADTVERVPEARFTAVLGRPVPHLALAPFEASAAAKLRHAAAAARAGTLFQVPADPRSPAPCSPP
ncbi:MAG: aldolase [Azospirillum sp.]|nr:aldolase [Azospirillum sp.]